MSLVELEEIILRTVQVKLEPVTVNGFELARPMLDAVSVHKAAKAIKEAAAE